MMIPKAMISIWQLAVMLVLVPTLCRAGGVGTRFYKKEFGTRLPCTRLLAQGLYDVNIDLIKTRLDNSNRYEQVKNAQGFDENRS